MCNKIKIYFLMNFLQFLFPFWIFRSGGYGKNASTENKSALVIHLVFALLFFQLRHFQLLLLLLFRVVGFYL